MQAPTTVTAYEAALPDDPRVERKQMFGTPCAFVNRQMFFGTFEDTLVARVGPERVRALSEQEGLDAFSPSEGRVWDDYIQLSPAADAQLVAGLALEALEWAAALPPKMKPSRKVKKMRRKKLEG